MVYVCLVITIAYALVLAVTLGIYGASVWISLQRPQQPPKPDSDTTE